MIKNVQLESTNPAKNQGFLAGELLSIQEGLLLSLHSQPENRPSGWFSGRKILKST